VIALVRVDNRLVHGQVLETWVPRLAARRILVADDQAAASALARAALALAVPAEVEVEVVPLEAVDWAAVAGGEPATLVLFREVSDLGRAVARGLSPGLAPRLNLGNVHFTAGRRAVTPSVFLSEQELRTVEALSAAGFEVEARAIPSDPPAGSDELARRWRAAG
jgi:mannose/fructose/N-acetylgalactosamine-specific phosphotransferase system component IIB